MTQLNEFNNLNSLKLKKMHKDLNFHAVGSADMIIDNLLDKGAENLYNKYINAKVNPYTALETAKFASQPSLVSLSKCKFVFVAIKM